MLQDLQLHNFQANIIHLYHPLERTVLILHVSYYWATCHHLLRLGYLLSFRSYVGASLGELLSDADTVFFVLFLYNVKLFQVRLAVCQIHA